MARIGFHTAMFGFNKNDVNMYLLKLQQEYALKEQELLKKLEDLEKANTSLNEKLGKTEADLTEASDELNRISGEYAYLKGKEQEIEQISESIGTMYMVAMQNAQDIISEAEGCAAEINEISAIRLEAAMKAEEQLKAIRENIKSSAERLVEDLSSMSLSLDGPKNRLAAQLNKEKLPEIPVELNSLED